MKSDIIEVKYNQCFHCNVRIRVGLKRCPKCGTWLQWDKNDHTKELRSKPSGDFWGRADLTELPELWVTDEAGNPVRRLVHGEPIYIVHVQGDFYRIDDGLVTYKNVLVFTKQISHGRIKPEARGYWSVGSPTWVDAETTPMVKELVPGARVEVFDVQGDSYRIGPNEWIWKGFFRPISRMRG